MQPSEIKKRILGDLNKKGIKGAVVSVERLIDIESNLNDLAKSGEINLDANKDIPQYQYRYEKIISGKKYKYDCNEKLNGAKAILILAIPIPVHQVGFIINGKSLEVLIPSDYKQRAASTELDEYLKGTLAVYGYKAIKAKLPLKLLAVRSGLAEYGRNNISYVEGMGSRLCLIAYYIDCHLPEDDWREPVRMKQCNTCKACINNCPTNAILENKRVIRAERCLVLYNEFEDDIPKWIKKEYHNAIIGCVKCEEKCPTNLKYSNQTVTLPAFNEDQTKELLQAKNLNDLSKDTYSMIYDYEINEYYHLFHRNFSLLVKDQ
jgi:epoxyqueuosine reductase